MVSRLVDPHVRIAGRLEDVQTAKERVMTVLDTRVSPYLLQDSLQIYDMSRKKPVWGIIYFYAINTRG